MMTIKNRTEYTIFFFLGLYVGGLWGVQGTLLQNELTNTGGKSRSKKGTIMFQYTNEKLTDMINWFVAQKKSNVILPTGTDEITGTVTVHIDRKLTFDEAWEMLHTVLDIAGYSLRPHGTGLYRVSKNGATLAKEVLPLYLGTDVQDLPDGDEKIRYLYYLSNLVVSDAANSIFMTALKELLPDGASYKVDPSSNALLITEKASLIKSVMEIIVALDKSAFKEMFSALPLRHTSADIVSKLFTDSILKTGAEAMRYNPKDKKEEQFSYFAKNVKIIPEIRTNKLLMLGKQQAVERITDFIYKYIDVELESGKSILHIYELLYLDAATFAPVLTKIVSSQAGGPAQAGGKAAKGLNRFFEGVLIKPATSQSGGAQFSSNKLVIAAKNEDWMHIKKLIEQLDTPQPQVILEVFIADLQLQDIRQLGGISRNAESLNFKDGVSIQSAQANQVIFDSNPNPSATNPPITSPGSPSTDLTVNANLLNSTIKSSAESTAIGGLGEPGSTIIAFDDKKDGRTWGILQFLEKFGHTKILSDPHIVATHGKKAEISIGETRLVPDEVTASASNPIAGTKEIKAKLDVAITPRISSANRVNLQVSISINEFAGINDNSKTSRTIKTNATVKSNDVLALGGLVRTDARNGVAKTPVLERIPILGWFFKRRRGQTDKTNLTVFISPTIIMPRLREGIGSYTKDYVRLAQKYSQEAQLFDNLRDPVTRFFFKGALDVDAEVDNFLARDESMSAYAQAEDAVEKNLTPIRSAVAVNTTPDSVAAVLDSMTKVCEDDVVLARRSQQLADNDVHIDSSEQADTRENKLRSLLVDTENPLHARDNRV